jgi:ABC-type cobalamin transport system permease subunit
MLTVSYVVNNSDVQNVLTLSVAISVLGQFIFLNLVHILRLRKLKTKRILIYSCRMFVCFVRLTKQKAIVVLCNIY